MKSSKTSTQLKMSRRTLLVTGVAAGGARFAPKIIASGRLRPALTLYYDKAIGAMRAVEKLIP